MTDIKVFKQGFPAFYRQIKGRGAYPDQQLPGATEANLQHLEASLGFPLPDSYKAFLRCAAGLWLRGGLIQFGQQHPFIHSFKPFEELTPQQRQNVSRKGGGWPPTEGMVCFAEFFMEADGDQVLFDVSRGLVHGEYPVMYYSHEDSPPSVRKRADTFPVGLAEFLTYPEFNGDN